MGLPPKTNLKIEEKWISATPGEEFGWLRQGFFLLFSIFIFYFYFSSKVPKYISDRWEKAPANTEVGKLKIKKKVGGAKPDVKFTLSDTICAPVAGLSENDKVELIRNSSTAKQIPKVELFY